MNTACRVFLVDDDFAVRDSLSLVFETAGLVCETFESAEHFLENYNQELSGCLVLDVNMPGLDGHQLQTELNRRLSHLPIIFLTAYGDIPMTVRAIKAGAVDFLTKPVATELLIERVSAAIQTVKEKQAIASTGHHDRFNALTSRELEIMSLVVKGLSNKEIGRTLGISYRTVEIHRGRVMEKTGVTNLLELVRLYEACGVPSQPG